MHVQTVPFGTRKSGAVAEVISQGTHNAIIFMADDEPEEAYVLLGAESSFSAGDRATITFQPGGSMGGFWHIEKEKS